MVIHLKYEISTGSDIMFNLKVGQSVDSLTHLAAQKKCPKYLHHVQDWAAW